MCTVWPRYNVLFGVYDIEPRYKRSALLFVVNVLPYLSPGELALHFAISIV